MHSLSAFALFLLVIVSFVTAVLSADTNSSVAMTSPTTAVNETSSSKTTVSPESVEPVNNDEPYGGAATVQATRTPQSSEATSIKPSLIHNGTSTDSAATTSKTVSELPSTNNAMVGLNGTKGSSTSAMSEKKDGANGVAIRVNAGFQIFSVVALVVCGIFS